MRCAMSAMASFSQRRLEGFNHISLLSLRPLNHRPLEGRQSSPSFIRPRDDHNAEMVLPSVAPFKGPDIESVAPTADPAVAPHVDGRCHQRRAIQECVLTLTGAVSRPSEGVLRCKFGDILRKKIARVATGLMNETVVVAAQVQLRLDIPRHAKSYRSAKA
jgi:hypothetical protein